MAAAPRGETRILAEENSSAAREAGRMMRFRLLPGLMISMPQTIRGEISFDYVTRTKDRFGGQIPLRVGF